MLGNKISGLSLFFKTRQWQLIILRKNKRNTIIIKHITLYKQTLFSHVQKHGRGWFLPPVFLCIDLLYKILYTGAPGSKEHT